jgi:hypothetical protein
MNDLIQNLLGQGVVKSNPFPANSRYQTIGTSTWKSPDGREIIYLLRRFLPSAGRFTTLQEHAVAQGERLDNLSAQLIGDPELFWQLCDANGAMQPEELTETPGRRIRTTLPEGVPGGEID